MSITGLTLKESMSKNIQAIMPLEEDKLIFEKHFTNFINNLYLKPNESEEFQKNLLKTFLQTCLPKNFINTYGRTDLAIYTGASPESSVGVLIECKRLSNKSEMISKNNYNAKAFQEIIHYYLNERLINNNIEIKKCVITNGLEWYIIEGKEVEKHFVNNKNLIEFYNKWHLGQLASTKTDFLYKEVISPAIDTAIKNGIKLARFCLSDAINNDKQIIKSKLTQLYRFFTAENLMNKEIFTDSNKLNKGFYDELLYLMGLEEIKIEKKKIIQRLPKNKRQKGSFVENIIDRLEMNSVNKEKHYENAIELTVVWINRILFLKLLESQLVAFNNEDNYKFLTKEKLSTFDEMYDLFFGVLAKKVHERSTEMLEKFSQVPYLNSSLFEETPIELSKDGISIDRLREHKLEFHPRTVLKDKNRKLKKGKVEFLTYLFEFLDAYDFTTSVRQNNNDKNNLINAAVLGLIFEKINGYNDGSYFTPGHITMYMSRNAIREAVLEKINEKKGLECKNISEVQYQIKSLEEAKEINKIINSLKICDPAVGSGHFLVSILNELIAIKSELRVLLDENGDSLHNIRCTVVNDELIIQDFNGDNFIYRRGNLESQRLQKTIFHEKKQLIENCLFGVDINPNSANICRLRLWIELLKSSYYYFDKDSKTEQLITLPNIDINIKVGNSLLYKFDIHESLDKRFSEFKNYTNLVSEYKSENDKSKKQKMTEKIKEIKLKFMSNIETPETRRVKKLRKLSTKFGQVDFFATEEELKLQQKESKKVENKLKDAINKLEASQQNPLFHDSLEWRMEFPEVLNEKGEFVGFDIVIANPPYIYSSYGFFSESEKKYFEQEYPLSRYQANTYGLFLELSLKILRKNGYTSMIIPNTFLTNNQYEPIRKHILEKTGDVFILNSYDKIFEDASVDNCIVSAKITSPNIVKLAELKDGEINTINDVNPVNLLKYDVINLSAFKNEYVPGNASVSSIIEQIEKSSKTIEPSYAIVRDGLKVYQRGKGDPKQTADEDKFKKLKAKKEWYSNEKLDDSYYEIIKGVHITRYGIEKGELYLKYGRHIAEPRSLEMFVGKRLLIRQIPRKSEYTLTAMYTEEPILHERSLIAIRNLQLDPYFLLGVLNSKVESYYAINKYDFLQRKTFPQLRLYQIKNLPIPNTSPEERRTLSDLVGRMLGLHVSSESEEEKLELIKELNNEIDEYVMNLYNLKDEEKDIIRDFTL